MNLFDLAAILIFVAAIILGFRSGAIPQVGGLAGAVAGGVAGVLLVPVAMGLVPELDPASRAIAVLVLVLVSVGAGEAVGSAIGRRLGARLGDGFAAAVDDVVGGLVGFAQGVLVVWLTGGILAAGAIPSLTPVAQTSTALRTISGVLPSPTELATGLGRALDVHRVLSAVYPKQREYLDLVLARCWVDLPRNDGREQGAALGRFVAERMLEARSDDGSANVGQYSYKKNHGSWAPTAPKSPFAR